MRRVLSAVIFLSFAVSLHAVEFDQGVDVSKTLGTVAQNIQDGANGDDLKTCSQVGMDAKQMALASVWNRCNFMGLEKNQCLYVCRDGRRITMPPAPDMDPTSPRACLQSIEAPLKALQVKAAAPAPQDPVAACKQKCLATYKAMSDQCYEMFDVDPWLRNCVSQAAIGYSYCTKDCEKPAKP